MNVRFPSPLLLTLLICLLYRLGDGYSPIIEQILLILALVLIVLTDGKGKLITWVWSLVFFFMALLIVDQWQIMDNHKFLLAYWLLACAIATKQENSDRYLSFTAQYLVGLVFFLAVFWKLALGEFLNGDFFLGMLLFDERFFPFTSFVGNILPQENLLTLNQSRDFAGAISSFSVPQHFSSARLLAQSMAWWTIFIESLIALSFLALRNEHLRNLSLLLFISTTYLLTPVLVFGHLLIILGYAQSEHPRWKLTFLLAFVFFPVLAFIPTLHQLIFTGAVAGSF